MVHKGYKRQYSFFAERNVRDDDVVYYALKIFDTDSDVTIFFDTKEEIKNLINELEKVYDYREYTERNQENDRVENGTGGLDRPCDMETEFNL
jgi:hypothetical protein